MALISKTDTSTHIVYWYQLDFIKMQEDALRWVATMFQSKGINAEHLCVYGKSFSTTFTAIEDVNVFIDKYKGLSIETATIRAYYKGNIFSLGIDFETNYVIGLICRKRENIDHKALEQIFDLA